MSGVYYSTSAANGDATLRSEAEAKPQRCFAVPAA